MAKKFKLEDLEIDIDTPEELLFNQIITNRQLDHNHTNSSVVKFIKIMKRKFNEEAKFLPKEPSNEFNREAKTDHFYQRNHKPIMAIKDCLISFVLVIAYYHPIVQTGGVSLLLGLFLTLDIYYKPNQDGWDNVDMLITSTVFFLISLSLSSLSLIDGLFTRDLVYYAVGYTSIFLVVVLFIRNLVLAGRGLYKCVKSVYRRLFKSEKIQQKKQKRTNRHKNKSNNRRNRQNLRFRSARASSKRPEESELSLNRESLSYERDVEIILDRPHHHPLDRKNYEEDEKRHNNWDSLHKERAKNISRKKKNRRKKGQAGREKPKMRRGGVPEFLERERKRQRLKNKRIRSKKNSDEIELFEIHEMQEKAQRVKDQKRDEKREMSKKKRTKSNRRKRVMMNIP